MKINIIFCLLLVLGLFGSPFLSLALTISPAKMILSGDPGDVIKTKMQVRNDLDITLTHYPVIERYTVEGGDDPVFLPAEFGLATWIEIPSEITIEPKESVVVPVTIRVPENAPPGGHYAVIFWSTAPPKGTGTGVGITTRVGALVLLNVSGEVIESGQILNFKASKKVFSHLPINFSYDFKNNGTVHLSPTGKVLIKNILGKTVAILDASARDLYALPDSTRTFTTEGWGSKKLSEIKGQGFLAELKRELAGFGLGFYKANLSLEFGKKPEISQVSFGFWVIPWRIIFFLMPVLALFFYGLIKGIKVYNRWIINQAKKRF